MAAHRIQGDTSGGKIGRIQLAFMTTASNGDDAAKDGGALDEREEVCDETET